jgi:hypothetical protein
MNHCHGIAIHFILEPVRQKVLEQAKLGYNQLIRFRSGSMVNFMMRTDVAMSGCRLVKIVAGLLLLMSAYPSNARNTLEELLKEPFFSPSDIEEVRSGGFGVAKVHEVSDREIAVAIACLVKGPPSDALSPFLGDKLPIDDKLLLDQGMVDSELYETSFAAISLGKDGQDEAQHYLEARPGLGLNLTMDEIKTFQALSSSTAVDQVERLLESMLQTRYLAYRRDGLAGALPYARESGEHVSPGEELRKSEKDIKWLHELYPTFHNAWLSYPHNLPDEITGEDFFWAKLNIEDRPVFVLAHRLEASNENMHLVGIRDYYISHFFDVSQRAAVVTQLESGDQLLIYVERAWVDYWSGFASLSRKIGQKMLLKQMEHLLEDHGICGK